MKKLLIVLLSFISISIFAQKQEQSIKKQKSDTASISVQIPSVSQSEIQALQAELNLFNDQNWVKQQMAIRNEKITLIYRTILLAHGIDIERVDNTKSTISPQTIIVKYKEEPKAQLQQAGQNQK